MRDSRHHGPIFENDWVEPSLPVVVICQRVVRRPFDCSQRLLFFHKEATIEERDYSHAPLHHNLCRRRHLSFLERGKSSSSLSPSATANKQSASRAPPPISHFPLVTFCDVAVGETWLIVAAVPPLLLLPSFLPSFFPPSSSTLSKDVRRPPHSTSLLLLPPSRLESRLHSALLISVISRPTRCPRRPIRRCSLPMRPTSHPSCSLSVPYWGLLRPSKFSIALVRSARRPVWHSQPTPHSSLYALGTSLQPSDLMLRQSNQVKTVLYRQDPRNKNFPA